MLACRNTPLHGRAGDVGILECSQLVAELEKMKNSQSQQRPAKTEGELSAAAATSPAADDEPMLTLGHLVT